MPEVPFTDVGLDDGAVESAAEVLRSGRFVKGPVLEEFEDRFAAACGVDHAVGVGSGTAALLLSLRAAGVGEGDEVFVPAHTFFATVSPVLSLGATPVFVDVDPATYTMDPDELAAAVESADRPAAVVPVHIYGCVADVAAIREVADGHGLVVVEDSCQAHFAERDGRPAGTFGDAGAFSFYPTKNLTAAGDGGMIVTDDADLAATARRLRNHGRDASGIHVDLGLNFRLDEVSAAVGRAQLADVRERNEARRAAAASYTERLAALDPVETPPDPPGVTHAYHLYVIQVPDRGALRTSLAERGVETAVHYPTAAHEHPAVVERVGELSRPVAERLADRVVSLPMHPDIEDEEVDAVCAAIEAHYE